MTEQSTVIVIEKSEVTIRRGDARAFESVELNKDEFQTLVRWMTDAITSPTRVPKPKPETVIAIQGSQLTIEKGGVTAPETDLTKEELMVLAELLARRIEGQIPEGSRKSECDHTRQKHDRR